MVLSKPRSSNSCHKALFEVISYDFGISSSLNYRDDGDDARWNILITNGNNKGGYH
jgi:hypothetical protein